MAARADSTGAPAMPLAPISSPPIPLRPFGCPEGVEPHQWRKAVSQRIEHHLSVATALVAILDRMDGDCDLEDNADDEPSLGGQCLMGPNGPETDLELDALDLGEADFVARFGRSGDAEAEPALGAPEQFVSGAGWVRWVDRRVDQRLWAQGGDVGEREIRDDDEPSIGYDLPDDSLPLDGGNPL